MDHSKMDHSQMEHSSQTAPSTHAGHQATPSDEDVIPELAPPPEAFEGPLHAPVPGVAPKVMDATRAAVVREVSGMPVAWLQADRFEYRLHEGRDDYLWDVQGYYGGDYDKFWFKSEGEGTFGRKLERAEVQGLWSHAITPWFDVQAGVRQDLVGPARTHAVIGIEGLAPYRFEVNAAAFLSNKGDLTARAEAELDERITQRLILQPRTEVNLAAQDVPELGIGAGLDRIEAGLRLRYEITRQFAPYIGIEQEWKLGRSASYARAVGDDPSTTNLVGGVRLWF
jgi:copper resistance protein B